MTGEVSALAWVLAGPLLRKCTPDRISGRFAAADCEILFRIACFIKTVCLLKESDRDALLSGIDTSRPKVWSNKC